jgi:hypothetical protein
VNWRRNELAHFGDQIAWLGPAEAAGAFDRATPLTSKSHYGLDPAAVAGIERLDVDEPGPEATAWLSRRIGVGTVLVVFDRQQVCRMDGTFFVRNWQDLLCPSRDDAVILSEDRGVVLFYCHEDEFEFGQQLKA